MSNPTPQPPRRFKLPHALGPDRREGYGCYFPSTGVIVLDDGRKVGVVPHGVEWLDSEDAK